jgi:hypothetical protein
MHPRPLTGKAAKWLVEYLKGAKPDPKKAERARRDREFVRRYVRPLRRARTGGPVWVDGGSIRFDPDRMEQAQVYIVELDGRSYGVRRSGRAVDVSEVR